MRPNFDTKELDVFQIRLNEAYSKIVKDSLADFRLSQSEVTNRRYQDASRRTPYVDGHKGSFGIKTGRLLQDISKVRILGQSVEQSSDLSYSSRIETLFKQKGTLPSLIPQSDRQLADAIERNMNRYFG